MTAIETLRDGLYFGEGPRWRNGRLWYSDLYDHAVHVLDESGHDERVVEVAAQPSGLGWLPDGRLLVVAMNDRKVLRREQDGTLVVHADLSANEPFRCNDMVVDSNGLAYVGGFGFDPESLKGGQATGDRRRQMVPTVLSLVRPDATVEVAADEMMFPNGAVITADGSTLIVAESYGGRLTAFDRQADGSLTGRRTWADFSFPSVVPDGICLDVEGAVWVANPVGPKCIRVGEGGRVLGEVEFSQNCYACALGGTNGRTLYAVTAPASGSAASVEPRGRVEAANVDVPGAGSP